ncbi:MAG TPA: hypothetical protein VKN18_32920 [Blastocatellia bacterium]|nr:hypothetical protein [Blastocatellia bacterium]
MKRIIVIGSLALVFTTSFGFTSLADSKARKGALKVCKQKYKNAVKGAKYLKSRDRQERIEQAKREREECERLAPK